MRGIVIAGTHSGCGKTTVTLGILAALRKKDYSVQSFKTGPDFIDTGLHGTITGKASRNLDLWMCGREYVEELFYKHAADANVAIVEGVMGLYDGSMSTAALAAVLGLPIILVVDAYGMAESAAAVVRGFRDQGAETGVTISGVIFNRVGSDRHYQRLKDGMQNMPVLGYLPRDLDFKIPHRHLGLLVAEEDPLGRKEIEKLADAVLEHIDIDALVKGAVRIDPSRNRMQGQESKKFVSDAKQVTGKAELKVGVAYDRAFCFYYEDNFDLLRKEGVEIVKFSPLKDGAVPDGLDALYIGGGYPELFADTLSRNRSMLNSIKTYCDSGMPVYAECGGFMYLTEGIFDFDENFHQLAGVYPCKTVMKKGRAHLGYREVTMRPDALAVAGGEVMRGHEFHYSEIKNRNQQSAFNGQSVEFIYSVKDGTGNVLQNEGYRIKNVLGSYIHIHLGSNPLIVKNLIQYIKERHGTDTVSRTR